MKVERDLLDLGFRPYLKTAPTWARIFTADLGLKLGVDRCQSPAAAACWCGQAGSYFCLDTTEGRMHICLGDWLMMDANGDFYPCKPDVFARTYEAMNVVAEVRP